MCPPFHRTQSDALRCKVSLRLRRQSIQRRRCLIPVAQRFIELPFLNRARFRQTHAIGRKHPGKGMQKHALHPQGIGHAGCMLPPCAPEALQRVPGHIMPALDADLLDGIGHVVDRDAQKPVRHLFRAGRGRPGGSGDLGCQSLQPDADDVRIQRQRPIRSENGRKMRRRNPPQHQVAVCDGQRSAPAVAGRTGVRPGTFRANLKAAIPEGADRPATSRHRMNVHHRRAHPHARHFRLE